MYLKLFYILYLILFFKISICMKYNIEINKDLLIKRLTNNFLENNINKDTKKNLLFLFINYLNNKFKNIEKIDKLTFIKTQNSFLIGPNSYKKIEILKKLINPNDFFY
jgi:hypothetical protein